MVPFGWIVARPACRSEVNWLCEHFRWVMVSRAPATAAVSGSSCAVPGDEGVGEPEGAGEDADGLALVVLTS